MRRWWIVALMLSVVCFGMVCLAQDVVAVNDVVAGSEIVLGSDIVADGYPLWLVILVAIIPIITTIMQRMGKQELLDKLKGAIEVGRTVFAAIEETEAAGAKKLIKEVMTGKSISPAGKEINDLLHSVTDVKAAEKAPPIKRFFRRMIAGQNIAGVVLRIGAQNAVNDLLNKGD